MCGQEGTNAVFHFNSAPPGAEEEVAITLHDVNEAMEQNVENEDLKRYGRNGEVCHSFRQSFTVEWTRLRINPTLVIGACQVPGDVDSTSISSSSRSIFNPRAMLQQSIDSTFCILSLVLTPAPSSNGVSPTATKRSI
jgi:hypothetical protein